MNDLYKDDPKKLQEARKILQRKARDHSRTPVQWTPGPNAGFCEEGIEPWMRVNDDYKTVNAEAQVNFDSSDHTVVRAAHPSVYRFWQECLNRRKEYKDIFVYGTFQLLETEHRQGEGVIAYQMAGSEGGFVVALNFSAHAAPWWVPENVDELEISNYEVHLKWSSKTQNREVMLRPWEGVLGSVVL